MMNTKTPRTNEESWAHPTDGTEVVDAAFARRLELELASLFDALQSISPMFDNDSPLLAAYSKEIDKARAILERAQ